MRSMTVGKRIGLTTASLVGLTVTLAIASLVSIGRLSEGIRILQVDSIPGQYASGEIVARANAVRVKMNAELISVLAKKEDEAARRQAETAAALKQLEEMMRDYERTITLEEDRRMFGELDAALARCVRSIEAVRATIRTSGSEQALAQYRSETVPAFDALNELAGRMAEWNQSQARKNAGEAAAAATAAKTWNWTVAVMSIFLGAGLSLFLVRRLSALLKQVARDLDAGAGQVASAAAQVSASSQSMAQGSSEQAASLEETSASCEEINSMARKNTENASQAANLVRESQKEFNETNRSLEQAMAAMGEIHAQSGKISNIIKTIDEIAFQTNILALNAAVEAARAGEAGMGFAVVADEVRSLAQRCAQAARDTAQLIEESIVRSNDGKTKVDQVAAAIRTLTGEAGRIQVLVEELNQSSQEQARGIEQIAKAVTEMERVTQNSAASAEEGAAAAEQLNSQSAVLREIVGRLTALVEGGVAATDSLPRLAQARS